jgi:AraC-like DNA-binding protein
LIETIEINILTISRITDMDWNIRNLSAPFWRFYWNEDTSGSLILKKNKTVLEPNKFYLIPPETPCQSTGYYKDYHNFIHFNLNPPYDSVSKNIYEISVNKSDLSFAKNTFSKLHNQRTDRSQLIHNMKVTCLITKCISQIPEDAFQSKTIDKQLKNIIEFMQENTDKKLDIQEISQFAHMSPQTLFRIFKKNLQTTPLNYFYSLKIKQACLWLFHSDIKIEDISEKLGFANRYHFTRIFTTFRGISPAKYKKYRVR